MSFMQKINSMYRQQVQSLQTAHDKRERAAEERTRQEIAKARTQAEKTKAKLKLQRDKLALKRELVEARIATDKARKQLVQAKREAGDLSAGERIGRFVTQTQKTVRQLQRMGNAPKKSRIIVRKKVVRRRR